jgi:hypothetical protein
LLKNVRVETSAKRRALEFNSFSMGITIREVLTKEATPLTGTSVGWAIPIRELEVFVEMAQD